MKPSDFFLGVVNFLGVLVPGAVLLFLRSFEVKDWNATMLPLPDWLIFGGIAYLIGQLLLAATEILNEAVGPFGQVFRNMRVVRELYQDVGAFREEASERLTKVSSVKQLSDQSKFHNALSYLRTKDPTASADVDHHMADYKLLRNLIAVLGIDITARALVEHQYIKVAIEFVLLAFCIVAFVRMYNWAQLLAFQDVCLIPSSSPSPDQVTKNPAGDK
jgi:hypothetical protein